MPVNLLIVGQTDRAETSPFSERLRASLQPAASREFRDLATSLHQLESESWIPDLVVVIQSWPDEFSRRDVERLVTFAPLARIVVCYGAWCESDGRNQGVWPVAVRISLHSAATRLEREWRLLHNQPGVEPLALSASRDEVFAVDHPALLHSAISRRVMVVSPDPAYRQYLEELVSDAGHVVETDSGEAAKSQIPPVVLFDADPWNEDRHVELCRLRNEGPLRRIIALQNLPQTDVETKLLVAGVAEVLPKLGDQQRLLRAVECTL